MSKAFALPLLWLPTVVIGRYIGYLSSDAGVAVLLIGYFLATISPVLLLWAIFSNKAGLHLVRTSWYVRLVLLIASLSALVGCPAGMAGCSGHPGITLPR